MRHALMIAFGFVSILFASSVDAQQSDGFARLKFIEGTYRVASGVPGDTTTATWRFRPILGGRYLELEEVLNVRFRTTIGFDSTSQRYRMSLLDAGTGAFDVYEGGFDARGVLILQNPNFWRFSFTATPKGLIWHYERSVDKGVTWKGGPTSEMIRIATP